MHVFASVALLVLIAFAALAGTSFVCRRRFRTLVAADVAQLLTDQAPQAGSAQLSERWDTLPEPARRYLRYAISEGAPSIATARLKHDGFFRTKPGKWLAIEAEEYFTVGKPGFVWNATVRPAPFLWIEVRDCLLSGRGNMLVKVNSALTIANARGREVDQSATVRWLMELVWLPCGFVGSQIQWEAIDEHSARVTLLQSGPPASMVVEIDDEGKLVRLIGDRYRHAEDGKEILTPWIGRCSGYRDFGGLRIPASVEGSWVLPEGEFCYVRFRVTELEFNASTQPAQLQ
jgi:hypothetical protein